MFSIVIIVISFKLKNTSTMQAHVKLYYKARQLALLPSVFIKVLQIIQKQTDFLVGCPIWY